MTLTQAATLTKRGILTTIALVVVGTISLIGYQIWHQHYLDTLPKVEEKAEMKFGPLPKIDFPPSSLSSSNYSYSLDTVTGGLPQTPGLIKVYFIPKTPVSLMSEKRSRDLADSLGFLSGPITSTPNQYTFKDNNNNELFIDITTGNLNFQRENLATGSSDLKNPFPPQNQLVDTFKGYLASKNLLAEELKNGPGYVSFNQGTPEDSDTATVSLLPDKFNNLEIVTAYLREGLTKTKITRFEEEKKKFISLIYIFWPIDKTTFSTYRIKSAEEALNDLKMGKGFIKTEPESPKVSISSVSLAYFEQEQYTPYLQPVFVFEGPNFTALVPAIKE